MAKTLKLLVMAVAIALAAMFFAACSSTATSSSATSSDASADAGQDAASEQVSGKHIIGVAVYNVKDDEVLMFRQYLEQYIASVCFEDVEFVYSESLSSSDDVIRFIDWVAGMGGEGIMSFYAVDLPLEVEECAKFGMYHIVASGSVSDEEFAKVEDNEYFLGEIGPGTKIEYYTGVNMVQHFVKLAEGGRYFVMSGGASLGNDMHLQRTKGMLDTLAGSYNVDLGDTLALATSEEPVTVEAGNLVVTIAPGYVANEPWRTSIVETFQAGDYDYVMSALPVEPITNELEQTNVVIGQVDCYSQNNQLMFQNGRLDYLVGKYGSLIGPSFAAMYNAITGHAADFREDGKAFKITQGMWTSEDAADFDTKYLFASNITTPAYNYEDLYSVCKEITPEATFDDLRALAEAYTFEDALARRGLAEETQE